MTEGTPRQPRLHISDLLHSIRILHADFAIIDFSQGQGYHLRNTRAIQIHFVLEGTLHFHFVDLDAPLIVSAGQYIFAPRALTHDFGTADAQLFAPLMHFEAAHNSDRPIHVAASDSRPRATLLTSALEIDPTRHESLVRLIPEVRSYRQRKGPTIFDANSLLHLQGLRALPGEAGSSAILHVVSEMLLANATRIMLLPGDTPADSISVPDAPQIAIALRLIHEHPERPWSVAALARETGMSRTVFAAAFQARLGDTPIRYLKNVRMGRAKALLGTGSRSLPEISRLSGYESEAAFARAFKREFGAAPGRYRRAARSMSEV